MHQQWSLPHWRGNTTYFLKCVSGCGVSNCHQPDKKISLTFLMISKFYSLIINRGDYCICLPTPLHRTKIVIYFCKQEDANANTQSPAGGCSISTFLRRGWDGASAGQRLTSQHDNAAVLNRTRWKNIWHHFWWADYFFKQSSLCAKASNFPDWHVTNTSAKIENYRQ